LKNYGGYWQKATLSEGDCRALCQSNSYTMEVVTEFGRAPPRRPNTESPPPMPADRSAERSIQMPPTANAFASSLDFIGDSHHRLSRRQRRSNLLGKKKALFPPAA
jgi:hypothetical protein